MKFSNRENPRSCSLNSEPLFPHHQASNNNYKLIFTLAATVSLASCIAFVLLVPSHVRPLQGGRRDSSGALIKGFKMSQLVQDVKNMGLDFYRMLIIVALYGMGHISEALLEARAMEVGFGKAESTLVVATLAFVTFVCAYPLGRLQDRCGPMVTFAVGMSALITADLILMTSESNPWAVFISLLFMGVHMGVFQGPILSIIVSLAPEHLRGTAFGIFYTIMAFTAMFAQSLLGYVWHTFGAHFAFGKV